MINSKILKRKFTVDTSLNHLYQMNQKAFKKSLSMISSKDDSATASLLGFAIANRVEPTSASDATNEPASGASGLTKGTRSRLQDGDNQKDSNHHNNKRGAATDDKGESSNTKGQSTNEKESGKAATRKNKALAR